MASSRRPSIPKCFEIAKHTWTINEFTQGKGSCATFSSPDGLDKFLILNMIEEDTKISFLFAYTGPKEEARFYHRYSILDSNGAKHHTREFVLDYSKASYVESLRTNGLTFTFYISLNECKELLVNGRLKIYCEAIFDNSFPPAQFKSLGKLSENYETLLESGKWSDFIVQIDDKQFRVHKMVLATRSPVFAAMLEHEESKEVKEGRVVIEDVEADVFEQLIRYIYTGKVHQLCKYDDKLLVAANKYQLDNLKSICEESLIAALTAESVCYFLLFSDIYNAEQLKSKCIEFVIEHAKQVMQTEGWKNLAKTSRAYLIAELFEKLVIKDD